MKQSQINVWHAEEEIQKDIKYCITKQEPNTDPLQTAR